MNDTTLEEKKVVKKKAGAAEQLWSIPKLGVSVMATSLEEALKKANKTTDK